MADDSDNYDSKINQDEDDLNVGEEDGSDFLQEDDLPPRPNSPLLWYILAAICSEWSQSNTMFVISQDFAVSLLAAQKEDLNKVMEYLEVKEQHARMLLIYHRWHVDRIFNLLEKKGMEQMFLEVG